MNKKLFIGGCGLAAIAGNVFAADEEYSYFTPCVALKGGYSLLGKRNDIKYKGGFAGAVEMGVAYDAWRAALELGFKSNKIKDFRLPVGFKGTNYILNGGFDIVPAAATLTVHTVNNNTVADKDAAVAAIAEKSVFEADATGNPIAGFYGEGVAVNNKGLFLKNVTEVKLEKLTAMTGMVNVFYDYAMTDAWSIYGGIGLGVARVNLTVSSRDSGVTTGAKKIKQEATAPGHYTVANAEKYVLEALPTFFDGNDNAKWNKTEISKTVFAWQLMAGVAYEINENWKLTFGYKFFNTGKVDYNGTKIKTPRNHTAEAGLILSF